MFKSPTVGLQTIVFSYSQTKGAAAFIKSNEALSRYDGLNFKVGGSMAVKSIPSVKDPDQKLRKDPDDTTGKASFLKW